MNTRSITFIGLAALLLAGCSTTGGERGPWGKGRSSERVEEKEPVLPTPAWWYARREYDPNFMTWGKIRHPQAA
ncbi:MAG: hypothetical protein JO317_04710, partial [Verrucomicrobiae bacterium]|nr:hypothetical protein [Verrucomicrobiae bacterium]